MNEKDILNVLGRAMVAFAEAASEEKRRSALLDVYQSSMLLALFLSNDCAKQPEEWDAKSMVTVTQWPAN